MSDHYPAIVTEAMRVPEHSPKYANRTLVQYEGRTCRLQHIGFNSRYSYNVYRLIPLQGTGEIELSEPEIDSRCRAVDPRKLNP